jgi:hypothetical protein
VAEQTQEAVSFLLQDPERQLQSRRASDQQHVVTYSRFAKARTMAKKSQADDLPDPTPGSVFGHGPPQLPADAHADPALGGATRNGKADQPPAGIDSPATDKALEIALTGEPKPFFQVGRRRPASVRGELGSALAPPVADHARTALGAHPLHEAVDPPAVTLLGLKSSLDGSLFLLFSLSLI